MSYDCHSETPRDGSGQLGRYLQALDPAYAPIDGRRPEDLLVFAKRYAAQIRFYDVPESEIEEKYPERASWREFFRRDIAVIAASIASVDTTQLKKDYDELRAELESRPGRGTFGDLFEPILGMARRIDRWYAIAIPSNPLRADLELAITSTLRKQMDRIRAFEEGFAFLDPTHPLKLDYSALNAQVWGLDKNVDADQSVYQGAGVRDKLRNAALYVDEVFHAFYGFIVELVGVKSVGYMQFALESYPAHQPHMALFIAFLELFRLAQDEMNGLTARMLDFYYRDVLHLAAKPAIPDRAHVVFELAKDVLEYDVTAGMALKGGKDAAGKDLTYATMDDLVVNQAKVKELRNVHIARNSAKGNIEAILARPVANSVDGFGAPLAASGGKWATFGKSLVIKTSQTLCDRIAALGEEDDPRNDRAQLGFALASPQLVLQGGNRLIWWHIPKLPKDLVSAIYLTGGKGWLPVAAFDSTQDADDINRVKKALEGVFDPALAVDSAHYFVDRDDIYVYLPVGEDAVVAFDPALHKGPSYATQFPVLRVMVDPGSAFAGKAWRLPKFVGQALAVRVGSIDDKQQHFDGLKALVLQSAAGLIDGTQPFDPFTQSPLAGMPFYVGSAEVFNKQYSRDSSLSELAVNLRMMIGDTVVAKGHELDSFAVYVLRRKQWVQLCKRPSGEIAFSHTDLARNILFEKVPPRNVVQAELPRLSLTPEVELSGASTKGFLRIDLLARVDFSAENLAAAAAAFKVKEISVNYCSELSQFELGVEQFFHLYPFGATEVFLGKLEGPRKSDEMHRRFVDLDAAKDHLLVDAHQLLLPQFTFLSSNAAYRVALDATKHATPTLAPATPSPCEALFEKLVDEATASKEGGQGSNQYSGDDQEEGILLIGLEGLRPLDTLSLLFEFAEGSALDEVADPPDIHWSYLTNNEWRPLKGESLVSDGTYGFQTTGIVRIDVPRDITSNNTIVTTGLHWFAASVSERSERIPMLVSVVAQAAVVQLRDNDNDPSHFDTALPPGSIGKLAVAVAEIAKVSQPFASFDGKRREVGKEFYTRVSERLRHKSRAITAWDYEHLVLDRFPSIYKVKCIQHTDPNCLCRRWSDDPKSCCGPQIAPGHVLVVPIANLKHRNAVNPLQPKTSRRTLLEIQDYLGKRTSPFVRVHARNPVYEQILVFFQVQFTPGTSKGYFLKKLNDEIVHFLTPWAFDEDVEVSFDQKVYASAIINFIESRTYVDFITDFLMFVCCDQCCPKEYSSTSVPLDEAIAKMKGCCDVERIFAAGAGHFVCDVIATPSTARSILVSAPRHFIIPYEAEDKPSPCEVRRAAKEGAAPPIPAPPVLAPAPPRKTPSSAPSRKRAPRRRTP